jgi:hypothetical protein
MPDLSPLSDSERAISIDLAGAHEQAKSLTPGRCRAVLVEPIALDRRQQKDSRHAVVGLYDYEQNRSVVTVVDLKAETVVSVEETGVQFQLDAQEQREAEELADGDARVREFLGGRPMNPLTRLYFPPAGTEADVTHRYAIVFLRPNNRERRYAVVDLSQREVIDVFALEKVASE